MTFPNFPKCTHNFCMILHHEYVRRVYSSRFLSRHNNDSELWILKPLVCHNSRVWINCVIALRQISVTALFYLEDSRRIHPRRREESGGERGGERDEGRERERAYAHTGEEERALGSFFNMFSSPWACPMQIGLRQECCSTWGSQSGPRTFLWPSFVLFSRAFPFLVF